LRLKEFVGMIEIDSKDIINILIFKFFFFVRQLSATDRQVLLYPGCDGLNLQAVNY
jgi:hypothetical protein